MLFTPPQSLDMNPIEHIWCELEKMWKYNIKSKVDLKDVLRKEWYNIHPDFIKNLVLSMPNRVHSIIRQEGNPTKY